MFDLRVYNARGREGHKHEEASGESMLLTSYGKTMGVLFN